MASRDLNDTSCDSPELAAIRRCLDTYGERSLREAARSLLSMVDGLTEENREWKEAVCGEDGWNHMVIDLRVERDDLRVKLAEAVSLEVYAEDVGRLRLRAEAAEKRVAYLEAELKEAEWILNVATP